MTELETMQRAKMYLDKLAQGIDPITNQEVPEDSVLNNVRLARCFFYVSDVLGKVIDNGGMIGGKPKLQTFTISASQLAQVRISQEPVRVTQLVDMIGAAVDNPQMKKLSTTTITNHNHVMAIDLSQWKDADYAAARNLTDDLAEIIDQMNRIQ